MNPNARLLVGWLDGMSLAIGLSKCPKKGEKLLFHMLLSEHVLKRRLFKDLATLFYA